MIGSTIGPYRITSLLGKGGMGEVYLADDPRFERQVAIKHILKSDDRDYLTILRREARAAGRLNHPNIASMYDIVEWNGTSFLVMEYVPGRNLAAIVRDGPADPSRVIEIGRQSATGLQEAHSRGILHRDLKPGNLQLTEQGVVKILDFGLAKRVIPSGTRLESGQTTFPLSTSGMQLVGTLPYMPPELLKSGVADHRGDVYSLGVTLFELATGHRPFDGQDFMSIALSIVNRPTPRAVDANPAVPQALSDVIQRAMEKEPDARYSTAGEFGVALAGLSTRNSRRLRTLIAGGMFAAVVIVAVYVGSLQIRPSGPESPFTPVLAVLPFLDLAPDSSGRFVAAGFTDMIGTSLAELPLSVIVPPSSGRFGAGNRNPELLMRELGAGLALDGTVNRMDQQIRVNLRLLRAGDQKVLWSRSIDGDLHNLLSLQSMLVDEVVVGLLKLGAIPEQERSIATRIQATPTVSKEAYADYIQAQWFLEHYEESRNIDRAVDLFSSAIRRDSSFVQAYAGLGEALWTRFSATKDSTTLEPARKAAQTARRLDPNGFPAAMVSAVIDLGTGRYSAAESTLASLVRRNPSSDTYHAMLAQAYRRQGKRELAIEGFQRAIALRPAYWSYHSELGVQYLVLGRSEEAVSSFSRVTELQPDNWQGFTNLGSAYHKMNRIPEARSAYEKSLALKENRAALSNLATIEFSEGRFGDAMGKYQRVVQIDSLDAKHWRNLGDCQKQTQNPLASRSYRRAISLCQAGLSVNPRDADRLGLLALCLAKVGSLDSALVYIRRALDVDDNKSDILYREAAIYSFQGNGDAALDGLERAIKAGFSRSEAATDPDFWWLKSNPRYTEIVSSEP